jgi:hypothetical protein
MAHVAVLAFSPRGFNRQPTLQQPIRDRLPDESIGRDPRMTLIEEEIALVVLTEKRQEVHVVEFVGGGSLGEELLRFVIDEIAVDLK